MSVSTELRQMLRPYYWFNILLSISYIVAKRTTLICEVLFPGVDCELDSRETEILFFLMIVVMLRTRKAGSVTMLNYLSSAFVYTKVANLILWLYADARYGLAFGAIFVLCGLVLPEPTYQGPENVIYFRGLQNMEEEFAAEPGVTWLVCFYAAWHPACVTFAPTFCRLSNSYRLDNLKFAKLDVGRFPEVAAKYRIQDGPTSRQLPSLLLFAGGKETARRPQPDSTGKLVKFLFSEDNVRSAFDLPGLYADCKKRPAAAKTADKASAADKKKQ